MEDLGSCSEVLRNMLVQVVPSGQEVPGAGGVLQLSTAVSGCMGVCVHV